MTIGDSHLRIAELHKIYGEAIESTLKMVSPLTLTRTNYSGLAK